MEHVSEVEATDLTESLVVLGDAKTSTQSSGNTGTDENSNGTKTAAKSS